MNGCGKNLPDFPLFLLDVLIQFHFNALLLLYFGHSFLQGFHLLAHELKSLGDGVGQFVVRQLLNIPSGKTQTDPRRDADGDSVRRDVVDHE